jgi:hypothetical protein
MPLLILAALVVIVLMLYIALGGKDGAPTVNLNKIFDFIAPKAPAGEAAQDEATQDGTAQDGTAPKAQPTETASSETPAKAEEPKAAEAAEKTPAAAEQTEAAKNDGAPDGAAFGSMEELTEFYRKEAERLTGIKH